MKGNEVAHLGNKLRELFEATAPEPLPARLAELLAALAAKDQQNDLIALMPNLRAFAFSLCGQHERADDFVQETFNRGMPTCRIFARRWICYRLTSARR